jgi:hypothetical protein
MGHSHGINSGDAGPLQGVDVVVQKNYKVVHRFLGSSVNASVSRKSVPTEGQLGSVNRESLYALSADL